MRISDWSSDVCSSDLGLGWAWFQLPTAFLPNEDQGFLLVDMQAPGEASANRTLKVIEQVEAAFGQEPAVERAVAISGFSFSGPGQHAGLAFITLKDWSEPGAEDAAGHYAGRGHGSPHGKEARR